MGDIETELKASIADFERILTVMPGDRTTLEFLCVAYAQLGEKELFLARAIALAEAILRDRDVQAASVWAENLKTFEEPQARAVVLRLQAMLEPTPEPQPEPQPEEPQGRRSASSPAVAAEAEIALLKRLVADGVLAEPQVRSAFAQLGNLPTAGDDFLISALLILEKENLTGAADAIAAVADAAGAPPVPLDAFDLSAVSASALPEKLAKVRGVVPFAHLGGEWAVALLNPLDEELKAEVSAALGAKCHFFLAMPSDVERALGRVQAAEEPPKSPRAAVAPVSLPIAAVTGRAGA